MAHSDSTPFQAIILAAGRSSRFKTGRTKLVEKICGREMVLYPTAIFADLKIPTVMVVGFQKDVIEEAVRDNIDSPVTFIHQEEQKGTGHAIACTRDAWKADNIVVMNGDMPLITHDLIERMLKKHVEADATLSFATAHHCDPEALYGRVIQADNNIRIIEAQDYDGDLSEQCCVNAGIYIIKRSFLEQSIDKLTDNNAQHEWYITDLVGIASQEKLKVQTIPVPFDRIRGVNDFKELWAAEQIKKSEIIQHWMSQGVRFSIAHNVHIDWDVTIGSGTFIGSGVQLLRATKIGKDCVVGAGSFLKKAVVGDRTTIHVNTVIEQSHVGTDAAVGPFSYIHGHSSVQNHATVGSFVEVNRSQVGEYSKAKHLSYLGDTTIGKGATIGAGLITCNYDSANKHATQIQDGAFIGGNNTIVAPVTIGAHAITAAGSTITHDVPENALAIARQHQLNKDDYAPKVREKAKEYKEKKKAEGSWVAPRQVSFKEHQ